MERLLFPLDRVHPDAKRTLVENHRAVIEEAAQAVEQHPWVVLGMAQNPVVKKARKMLEEQGIRPHYLEYGSYLGQWRKRNAWKMWTGWPTFPMVFHEGVLIGGAKELARYLKALDR
ncbi:MAG: glutaredoxin [Myxococcota bacterium]